jgi:TPR repeat protein
MTAKNSATDPFELGHDLWRKGQLRDALDQFRIGAKDGDPSCILLVGYFYDAGLGVRKDRLQAMQWYRSAHRRGDSGGAANNIGMILSRENDYAGAMRWFRRAISRGNSGARLHIAEMLAKRGKKVLAVEELTKLVAANDAAAETIEQASAILRKLQEGR